MHDFLPNKHDLTDQAYHTACFLTLASSQHDSSSAGRATAGAQPELFESGMVHNAFRQTLDPAILSISEKQRFRFSRAMRQLQIKPCFHLSELEPLVVHPIEDELLDDICSCSRFECPGACTDIHSWDRPCALEQVLKIKSKGTVTSFSLKLSELTKCYSDSR
jgi:hypothetical protein